MSNTKNQHYVTDGLLQFFTNEQGGIYEFLVERIDVDPYPINPRRAMCAEYTYEHELLDFNLIENYFAEGIDAESPNVVRKIINEIEKCKKCSGDLKKVREKLFRSLKLFLLHYYRSGALLKEFSFNGEEKKIALMARKILDVGYINLLSESIKDFYKFAIIESDDNFLMSDQYISTAALKVKSQFQEVSNRNIGLKETIILIPLSSKYYVVFWNSDLQDIFQEFKINYVEDLLLEKVNRVIVNNSYEKCVGLKEKICGYMQNKFKRNSPSGIVTTGLNFIKKKEVFWSEQETLFWESFKNYKKHPDEFKCGRNDECLCGSGKKYKKCHNDYTGWWNNIIETLDPESVAPFIYIGNKANMKKYAIKDIPLIEGPIDQY